MKKIYKYPLALTAFQEILLPKQAEILKFDNQDEIPTIWVLVDPEAQIEQVKFILIGTGQEVSANLTYIGTAQFSGGHFVWHLYV